MYKKYTQYFIHMDVHCQMKERKCSQLSLQSRESCPRLVLVLFLHTRVTTKNSGSTFPFLPRPLLVAGFFFGDKTFTQGDSTHSGNFCVQLLNLLVVLYRWCTSMCGDTVPRNLVPLLPAAEMVNRNYLCLKTRDGPGGAWAACFSKPNEGINKACQPILSCWIYPGMTA